MSSNLNIRVTDEEAAAFKDSADRAGLTLTAHLRKLLGLDGGAAGRIVASSRKGKGTHPTEGRCMRCVENRSQSLSSLPPCPQCPCHARVAAFVVPG